ncbi:MAG: hypothetical protein KatS3mg057_1063 [Herpetosiphonaceae bacterium]|nr:MAG: hypothetical protein KatS3mg057_1063 [Herpetosiphonaceae bacterium]
MTERKGFPRPEEKHPEQWREDLNPDAHEGVNYGVLGPHPEKRAPTAYDLKDVHAQLRKDFDDAQLKMIPILPPGTRLEQGAVYIDLNNPQRREFTATGDMEAGPDNRYVPKTEVPYWIWNTLIGVQNPERLNMADE